MFPELLKDVIVAGGGLLAVVVGGHFILQRKVQAKTKELQLEIAERQRVENALRESEERYRALFENNPIETIIVNNEARVTGFNLAKKKSGSRLPHPGDVMYKDYASRHKIDMYGELQECIRSKVLKEFPEQQYDSRCLYIRISPFSGGAIITSIDLTAHKMLEKEFAKIEKLESIGVLAGGIAHDFNNLLAAILGNLYLAKRYANPADKVFEKLTDIEEASLRARDLTLQLLTFSKGGAPIKKTAAIADLIKASTRFVLRGSNVRCEYLLPPELWPVEVDRGQFSQVLHNLVINADQAMPDGGIITISAQNVLITAQEMLPLKAGRYVKLSIADQGLGIKAEHLSKIFDPFFSTKETGSGLGLAVAYSIIKNHDGLIAVESKPGAGTTIHLFLPASEKTPLQVATAKEDLYTGQGRILVMDDDDAVRKIAAEMLRHLGYTPELARDGREALELYQKNTTAGRPFAAVIMDLTIPGGMGGREAVAKLLAIDPAVKAIVSSGYANDPVMADFRRYGFSGIAPKPYKIQELSRTLHQVTGQSQPDGISAHEKR